MRFMTLYKPGRENDGPPTQDDIEKMSALIAEMAASGVLVMTDGLQSSKKGARVRINDPKSFTVTDGPFTEAKEIIGGFAILNVSSLAEAIEATKKFLSVVGEGEVEVRQMHDAPAHSGL